MIIIILTSVLAYLLGSIPSAVWYGKIFHKIDVRQHGSGNAGATNTLRILGNKAGFIVFFLDFLKGFIATKLPALTFLKDTNDVSELFNYQILFGVLAVVGHVFPVFAGFKGGKGVAVLFAVLFAMDIRVALICLAVFILLVWITRYISVGSMAGALTSPIAVGYFYGLDQFGFLAFCSVIAIAVVYLHRPNIKRLLAGNENRFSFKSKTK
ncbi:MAG: glycerol-3-phosphate 1-O-acyltransferase PlsY [Bacteroidota bacterium]